MLNMATIPVWRPDLETLRSPGCRVALGYGETSGETLASRAPRAIAAALGTAAVGFPGEHVAFVTWDPAHPAPVDAFVSRLREVLG